MRPAATDALFQSTPSDRGLSLQPQPQSFEFLLHPQQRIGALHTHDPQKMALECAASNQKSAYEQTAPCYRLGQW